MEINKEELPEGLFTECCRADFDPLAVEVDDVYQEKCLKCKRLCEPRWFNKGELSDGKVHPGHFPELWDK